jgi:hypothetical protein
MTPFLIVTSHELTLSFSISPPLADVLDISQVASNFGGSFMGVVQYNMDNTAFEVGYNNLLPYSPELRQP